MDAQKLWRAARTPLVLLALIAVVALGTLWAWQEILKPPPAAQPAPCVPQQVRDGKLLSQQVTVAVDNSGTKRGLASQVARSLTSQKFVVSSIGNSTTVSTQDIVVLGYAVDAPEVKLVAAQFPKAEVRADTKMTDHLVRVVVGDQFGGMKDKAAAAIAVDVGSVCLPALPSPSASPSR
ncbi:LytR C-terminal domain-containing protein [Raineyella fluvialis]|uniref:LytR family transcriptional regulator n=1 Tax=Raineyella fluvialis TaxID=2662261 RepID=A0A5Q2F8A4_9ACTN|nr:LytR C-terminal domain-containing protein [Raineyella fluvialis]QGF22888.1 LytR family transcriptional regulator [Raineyella fluvialis]